MMLFAFGNKQSEIKVTIFGKGERVEFGKLDDTGSAWGTYIDGAGTASNFGSLSLQSSKHITDAEQMYAIGFAEGVLTQKRIYQQVINLRDPVLKHYGAFPRIEIQTHKLVLRYDILVFLWCNQL